MKSLKWLMMLTLALTLIPWGFLQESNAATSATPASIKEKEKVIIDADMGELNDDSITMFMLANAENVNVLGVTIVAGNTWAEEGTAYTLRQLELIKRTDIPVIVGAGEPLMGSRQTQLDAEQKIWGNSEYLGSYARQRPKSYLKLAAAPYGGYPTTKPLSDTTAVDFIIQQVKKYPNQVTLFAIGPATNIALAVKKNPEIVPLVKQIIYMGGAIDIPGNTSPAAEFNWWFDPESIKITLRTPFKRQIVVPNDVAERVYYNKSVYDRIVKMPETPIVKMFKDLQSERFAKNPKAEIFVWDAITAAIFLDPKIATKVESRYIDIDDTYGPNYGKSIGYHESRNRDFNKPENFPSGTQKVEIVFDIDREAFWNLYVKLMTKK
ncbi:nucleoside hydrolase [Paenibacillus sp. PL91]|uniref:nucleoside hydrolase n=1 Tax=Paenibacillus sp. PL91 TaxID=2729538 RepID=UPI00145DE55B|nr:nucleoside hydrolase [Paenibacillus sp. PL91]MBC9204910.1 nucleoside hydrolase [Paenibacillus sp. PL91]